MKLSNKFYTFEEKMKKNFIVKNKLNKTEFNKNEKMLLKYQKLNNEKTELFDAIQKFREYRDKAIEIKYDYDKLIEREMEILTMEKEREKRFKNNLKKETRKIHESNLDDSILDGDKKIIKIDKSYKSEYEKVDKNLRVNYNARCKEYKNIKCTKYVFIIEHSIYDEMNNQIYNNFLNKIYKYRYTAFKHFMLKNNIQ
jgi:hypothetical protein